MTERALLCPDARPLCAVAVCDKPVSSRGLCQGHYLRLRKHGDPGTTPVALRRKNKGKVCAADGCDREARARGWCWKHYQRWQQHGDPNFVSPPPEHGTVNMYSNLGCRCDECRRAKTDYCRERGIAGYAKDPCPGCGQPKRVIAKLCRACDDAQRAVEHGTEGRYRGGCRCEDCRTAASAKKRERRLASRVPCSHGCGTLVDSLNRRSPEKPPECRPCAMKRIHSTRRQESAVA